MRILHYAKMQRPTLYLFATALPGKVGGQSKSDQRQIKTKLTFATYPPIVYNMVKYSSLIILI